MKTVLSNEKNSTSILFEAKRILDSGGIVVAPTDTVYGILGRADKETVVKKMLAIKKRPEEKAFPIFVKDIATARKYAYISDAKAKFLEKIWPGPMTAVFLHKGKLPEALTGGQDTIGIRIPNHPFVLKLLSQLDFPLAQTSANISGKPPAKNQQEIKEYFGKAKIGPDLVIDAGTIEGKPSTVVDFTGREPIILRTGLVLRSDLDTLFKSMK